MKCPVDQATLLMSERRGIEVDYCPECRGVWLDRGELDRLIAQDADRYDEDDRGDRRPERDDRPAPPAKKKRTAFLSEIFEGLGGGEAGD